MGTGIDWKRRIVDLVQIKQAIADLDQERVWQYTLPRLAASEHQLLSVERDLGEPLDPDYREFLKHAGGWPAFYQTVDLFGPEDLIGGNRSRRAVQVLHDVEEEVLSAARTSRQDLLPIAVSLVEVDIFVMTRRTGEAPGSVIWIAEHEIDRYPSFDEYFLAMMDYNRAEVEALRNLRAL